MERGSGYPCLIPYTNGSAFNAHPFGGMLALPLCMSVHVCIRLCLYVCRLTYVPGSPSVPMCMYIHMHVYEHMCL